MSVWIDINNEQPPIETRVITYSESHGVNIGVREARNNPRKFMWFYLLRGKRVKDVTHWMHLPKYPTL